jgi:hypothetical protein
VLAIYWLPTIQYLLSNTIIRKREPSMKLQNKTAIVTGGAQGMGRAIVLRYAAKSANVVVADLNLADAQALANEIEQAGG